MKSRQPHIRSRPFWAAISLACAFVVVLGFASTPASARSSARIKIVVTSTSPAQPVAGQTFTMKFELSKLGVPLHMAGVACYATAGGKFVPPLTQRTDGTVGTCSWAVPSAASGRMFDGILAVQKDDGAWWYRGFDLPIS
jgi:hypothetical protein